ncbi:MAG TPA: DUF86 domain-containing protein [Phycisphaerales bacterium]|nr:DUF86 domain-containing protein [Phycisphaerales bacterium]
MPRREPSAYVWDVRDACQSIVSFLAGMSKPEYLADEKTRAAVERKLITLGEAMNRLSALDPGMAAELGDAAQIVAFRNTLVHGYFKLDHDKVWTVLEEHLPPLHAAADTVWARFAPLYEAEDSVDS